MKTRLALATALTAAALAAQAGGIVFNTPVTYSEPVTYAAGVTYLAPVTYAKEAAAATTAEPVMLERVIVTPKRSYTESEWRVHVARRNAPRLPLQAVSLKLPHWQDLIHAVLPLR